MIRRIIRKKFWKISICKKIENLNFWANHFKPWLGDTYGLHRLSS